MAIAALHVLRLDLLGEALSFCANERLRDADRTRGILHIHDGTRVRGIDLDAGVRWRRCRSAYQ